MALSRHAVKRPSRVLGDVLVKLSHFRKCGHDGCLDSGTTDPHSGVTLFVNDSHCAPSGAFLAKREIIDWDDPELCKLVKDIDQRFGQLRDNIERQEADQM